MLESMQLYGITISTARTYASYMTYAQAVKGLTEAIQINATK